MRRMAILALGGLALLGGITGSISLIAQTGATKSQAVSKTPVPALAAAATSVGYEKQVAPLLNKYCAGCHGGKTPPAGIRLSFANEDEARKFAATERDYWARVGREISSKSMPPANVRNQPADAERALLNQWVEQNLSAMEPDPGPFMVHRLNNREYANSVRELVYLPADYNASADFPADERGDGFDNNAGTLTISPLLIERYLDAAEKAVVESLSLDPKKLAQAKDATLASKNKLNEPSAGLRVDFADRQQKIRLNMEVFAPRAFRRPVSKEEIDGLMKFAALSFAHAGESFDEATALAVRAALMSPEFLFRMERDPEPDGTGKVFEITEYQLASRMSYFLWSTMPDNDLYIAARDHKLRADLDGQIRRMLQDPKSISLTKDFLGQWLEIRGLHEVTNAPKSLLASMQGETEHFFDYIVRNDRSLMEFLDSDYTFVNEELAKLYGIPGVTGPEFRKVKVNPTERGGIFTQAGFLTLTSKPLGDARRTSPVLRGKWILENIFMVPIPPPPPDVPALKLDTNKELKGTVRQIFEQHRVDPSCAGCHARMDPYGFALENYDGYGAWRNKDNGEPIDASGEIMGRKFRTPVEFRAILMGRKDEFRRAIVSKLVSYSLGRGLQPYDRRVIDGICAKVKAEGDRLSSVVTEVIKSYPFQHARGMKGQMPDTNTATTWYHPVPDHPYFVSPPAPPRPGRGQGGFGGFGGGAGRGGLGTPGGQVPPGAPNTQAPAVGVPGSVPNGAPAAVPNGAPAAVPKGAPAAVPNGAPAAVPNGAPAAVPNGGRGK
ncbi:MAG: DUF1592 domain-containing protein [Candidatus Solibacter sp.]